MNSFELLRPKLDYLDNSQIEEIHKAFAVAESAHLGQKRKSGEEYLSHPIEVAILLANMRMDYQSIMAALLHDVIEDTSITKDFIIQKFGPAVANLVDGVTKLSQIEFASKAEAQAESFRKMILAMSRDIRVILVKLADRLHNMRTLEGLPPEKRKYIAKETLDIYAPIAKRLGIHTLALELEKLAFPFVYPTRYKILKESLEKIRGNHKEVMQEIDNELKEGFKKSNLKDAVIFGREKHLYGIYKKMLNRRIPFSEINDVYAFRIIVNSEEECYQALGIVHKLYKPLPGKIKDYIAIPKFNGYQSLHTTLCGPYGLPIEIQIRTPLMDKMANNGIAAHWIYKSGDKTIDTSGVRAQQWVNDLLEIQQNTGDSLEFLENVKIDLFPDEVYVFTPKGYIIELPRGASVIDFAYAVHTDIGNTCVAARIDRQFSPLSTTLINGQSVSVITSPQAMPNPAWLKFVVTGKARSGIKNFLKNRKQSEIIELGKQLIEKSLHDLSLSLSNIPKESIEIILKETKVKTLNELYEDVGLGNSIAAFVAHQIFNALQNKKSLSGDDTKQKPLLIKDAQGVAINFASCCLPIPGDNIIGHFSIGQGLMVHKQDCHHINKLVKHPEKCIPVTWADDIDGDFTAAISVEMLHQRGALAELAKAIADGNSFISDISMNETGSGYCLMSLKIMVRNITHLENLLEKIRAISIVAAAKRK